MDIAAVASALSEQRLRLEVGTRVAVMAKDVMEDQAAALVKLLESAKALELSVQPHLGSILDVVG
ncbi:MAG: YjfB family protein [Limnochordia bacterium]|nr:YjfB family protein [Bacillota bacterium]